MIKIRIRNKSILHIKSLNNVLYGYLKKNYKKDTLVSGYTLNELYMLLRFRTASDIKDLMNELGITDRKEFNKISLEREGSVIIKEKMTKKVLDIFSGYIKNLISSGEVFTEISFPGPYTFASRNSSRLVEIDTAPDLGTGIPSSSVAAAETASAVKKNIQKKSDHKKEDQAVVTVVKVDDRLQGARGIKSLERALSFKNKFREKRLEERLKYKMTVIKKKEKNLG